MIHDLASCASFRSGLPSRMNDSVEVVYGDVFPRVGDDVVDVVAQIIGDFLEPHKLM